MYDIFTYMWLIFMVNVGKYTIHVSYGFDSTNQSSQQNKDFLSQIQAPQGSARLWSKTAQPTSSKTASSNAKAGGGLTAGDPEIIFSI